MAESKPSACSYGECGHTPERVNSKIAAFEFGLEELHRYARATGEFLRAHGASSYILAGHEQLSRHAIYNYGKR